MLFTAIVALLGIWTVGVWGARSVFSRLTFRLIAFNANWNPWRLRRRLQQVSEERDSLLHAQRLGTKIVGCLSENEIHQHHMRIMRGYGLS